MCEITWAPRLRPGCPRTSDRVSGHRRRWRALVLLDRNHVSRPRNPPGRGVGAGVGGGSSGREMALDAALFAVDNSVAVVVARDEGEKTPGTVPRTVSRIVFESPAARSPTVHVRVIPLNSAGAEPGTSSSPPKLTVTAAAVAVAVPLFRS